MNSADELYGAIGRVFSPTYNPFNSPASSLQAMADDAEIVEEELYDYYESASGGISDEEINNFGELLRRRLDNTDDEYQYDGSRFRCDTELEIPIEGYNIMIYVRLSVSGRVWKEEDGYAEAEPSSMTAYVSFVRNEINDMPREDIRRRLNDWLDAHYNLYLSDRHRECWLKSNARQA